MSGMAFGSWIGGALFDAFLSYRVAFSTGVLINAGQLLVILFLVGRSIPQRQDAVAAQPSRATPA
jgi:predicted MFS family arabinose efflux permease